jgi:hypothetical protein
MDVVIRNFSMKTEMESYGSGELEQQQAKGILWFRGTGTAVSKGNPKVQGNWNSCKAKRILWFRGIGTAASKGKGNPLVQGNWNSSKQRES